jgi:hypothetical protein
MTWVNRLAALVVLLAPSVWLAVSYPDLPLFGRFFDDGLYLSSARGIAEGKGYRIESLPGAPPQVKYPPLVPLVMASAWKAGNTLPEVLRAASWMAWLPFAVFVAIAWLWLRTLPLSRWSVAVILAAVSVNHQLLLQSRLVMTDLWGLDFLLLALWAASRERPRLAGLAAAAGFLARVACLPVVAVISGFFLYRRQFRHAIQFLICATPALLWWFVRKAYLRPQGTDGFLYAYSEYGDHFRPVQILNNLPSFAASAGWLFLSGGPETWWKQFLLPVVTVVGIAGVTRMWRSFPEIRPYAVFGILYSTIVLCWRFAPGPRFLLPLLPLLAAGIAFEAEHLSRILQASWRKGDRTGPAMVVGVFAFLFFTSVHASLYGLCVTMPRDFAADRNLRHSMEPFYEWARKNLQGARVVTSYDGLFYLETGVQGARIPDHFQMKDGDHRSMDAVLRDWSAYAIRNGYTHMVITEGDFGIEAAPDQLALVDAFASKLPELESLYRSPSAVCYRFSVQTYSGINPMRALP